MMIENAGIRLPWVLVFAIFLLVPSFDTALKYFGSAGVAVYFLAGTLLLAICIRFALPILRSSVSQRGADYLAAATFIFLAAAAMYIGPIANSGRFGPGSDADDALITAVTELVNGRYPYYLATYLGNAIGPMPGSVIFSLPFVVLGLIQLQNVFWLAVFYLVFRHYEKSSVSALSLLWLVLALSPTVIQNVATGADYVSNTIFIMVFMWILIRETADSHSAEWKSLMTAVFLGLALSSRSTFFLLIPLLYSVLIQSSGLRAATKYMAISGTSFLLVTVPFWLYDPAGFSPLHIQSAKLNAVEDFLPFARLIIPGSAALLSVFLATRRLTDDLSRFFIYCGIVQLYVLLLTAVVYSLRAGQLDLYIGQSGYGMFSLFFGAAGLWIHLANGRGDNSNIVERLS